MILGRFFVNELYRGAGVGGVNLTFWVPWKKARLNKLNIDSTLMSMKNAGIDTRISSDSE